MPSELLPAVSETPPKFVVSYQAVANRPFYEIATACYWPFHKIGTACYWPFHKMPLVRYWTLHEMPPATSHFMKQYGAGVFRYSQWRFPVGCPFTRHPGYTVPCASLLLIRTPSGKHIPAIRDTGAFRHS